VTINRNIASVKLDARAFILTITRLNAVKDFDIIIEEGIYNPTAGPYAYDRFQIEFQTDNGYPIDGVSSSKQWIYTQCGGNCAKCSGKLDNCEGCGIDPITRTAYYLSEGLCQEDCKPGFYAGSEFTCRPCEYPCVECKFGPQKCTKCNSAFEKPYANPSTLTCEISCPVSTYLDQTEGVCRPCVSPCYYCKSRTECLSCDRGADNAAVNYFESLNKCFPQCPETSVTSPSKKCLDCIKPCKTCKDIPEKCSTCLDGYFLHKGNCVASCPMTYIADKGRQECISIG
jgi:proprotein convertase subtilisin/kexin type 5